MFTSPQKAAWPQGRHDWRAQPLRERRGAGQNSYHEFPLSNSRRCKYNSRPQPNAIVSRAVPIFQQIAFVDTETGNCKKRRLQHREETEKFYRDLAVQGASVRVGMEARGHARWFVR
jgi:hypothetical protein